MRGQRLYVSFDGDEVCVGAVTDFLTETSEAPMNNVGQIGTNVYSIVSDLVADLVFGGEDSKSLVFRIGD